MEKHLLIILLFSLTVTLVFPVSFPVFGSIDLSAFEIILVVLGLSYFLEVSLTSGGGVIRPVYFSKEIFLLGAFAFFSMLSLMVSKINGTGLIAVVRYFEAFIVLFVGLSLLRKSKIHPDVIVNILMAVAVVATTFAIVQHHFSVGLIFEGTVEGRVGGLKHGPGFASFMSTGFIISGIRASQTKNVFGALGYFLAIIFFAIGIYYTGTRTWLASSVIVLGIYVLMRYSFRDIILLFLLGSILVLPLYFLADFQDLQYYDRFSLLFDIDYLSTNVRLIKWQSSWLAFMESPLFGVGPDNLDLTKYSILPKWALEQTGFRSDSQHFDLLAMHGIIGYSLFLSLNFIVFKRLYKRRKSKGMTNWIFLVLHINWMIAALFWGIIYHFVGLFYFISLFFMIYSYSHKLSDDPKSLLIA